MQTWTFTHFNKTYSLLVLNEKVVSDESNFIGIQSHIVIIKDLVKNECDKY